MSAFERDSKLQAEYKGCAQVASCGARIMARLQVYEAAARFQVSAEEAVRAQADESEMPLRMVHLLLSQAGASLAGLANALLGCPARPLSPQLPVITAFQPEGETPARRNLVTDDNISTSAQVVLQNSSP